MTCSRSRSRRWPSTARATAPRTTDYFAPHHEEEAEETPPVEEGAPAAEGETEDSHAPDDALGLYLRQMGAIPLLNRDQELALAERLELRRGATATRPW